jgi:hypothetical protein
MDYLVKIRSVQTPLNGQFSIGANTLDVEKAIGACFLGIMSPLPVSSAVVGKGCRPGCDSQHHNLIIFS